MLQIEPKAARGLGSWDTARGTVSVTGAVLIEVTSCQREMLLKGVTLDSCQSKYLPLRTRKAEVKGDQAESYLACPLVCRY